LKIDSSDQKELSPKSTLCFASETTFIKTFRNKKYLSLSVFIKIIQAINHYFDIQPIGTAIAGMSTVN
jgi:hypothetical protein